MSKKQSLKDQVKFYTDRIKHYTDQIADCTNRIADCTILLKEAEEALEKLRNQWSSKDIFAGIMVKGEYGELCYICKISYEQDLFTLTGLNGNPWMAFSDCRDGMTSHELSDYMNNTGYINLGKAEVNKD